MSETQTRFEKPRPIEKLSHKFILDSLMEEPVEEEMTSANEVTAKEESHAPVEIELSQPAEIPPDKKYFRIGETAELMGVEPHVLRYWEKEFSAIRPMKSRSGQRVYSRKDVEIFKLVHHLLYTEKFSVQGAKRKLRERDKLATRPPTPKEVIPPQDDNWTESLGNLANSLRELIAVIQQ